jgi:LPS sulfotransferase NodH
MRFLCIFAMPRTGSSHLNKLLKSCPQFNAKSELFHAKAVARFSKEELETLQAKADGASFEGIHFNRWRRNHPRDTLEALYEGGGSKIVAFKVFPNHLKRERIQSDLLARDDTAFAVLKRRPMESFISGLKARSLSVFGKVDTTEIKPSLSVETFVDWAARMKRWYDWTGEVLEARGLPYATLSYEEHLDGQSGAESLTKILPLLAPLGFADIAVPVRVWESERQDREPRFQDRVANWDAFETAAKGDPSCDPFLEWALGAS